MKTYRLHSKEWLVSITYSAFTPHSVGPVGKTQNGIHLNNAGRILGCVFYRIYGTAFSQWSNNSPFSL